MPNRRVKMLSVIGHIYSDSIEKVRELVSILEADGLIIAYDSPTNATVIKEVEEVVADE